MISTSVQSYSIPFLSIVYSVLVPAKIIGTSSVHPVQSRYNPAERNEYWKVEMENTPRHGMENPGEIT